MKFNFYMRISMVSIWLLMAANLYAQRQIVTGHVTDENGKAFIGVTVVAKDSNIGVVTNKQGQYTINAPKNCTALVFSALGYQPQTVNIDGKSTINASMAVSSKDIDEVVVIAYGSVKKKDLTGAVGQVDVENLAVAPVGSFADALAGRLSGVQVSMNDGQPGAEPSITIRGSNSLTQSNSPLFIIDGVAMENFDMGSISMEDIESMNVLKDASAIAIYGARAANGVFVITSKKGKTGEPTISFSAKAGISRITKTMDMMSTYEYVRYLSEFDSSMADRLFLRGHNKKLEDYIGVEGTDWQKEVLRDNPLTMIYDLSVRGGGQRTKYSVSGSYFKQDGILDNSGNSTFRTRFNLDQTIGSKVKTGISASLSRSKDYGQFISTEGVGSANISNLLYRTWAFRPYSVDGNIADQEVDDDLYSANDFRVNPKLTNENEYRQRMIDNINLNAYVEYTIIPSLKLRVLGAMSDKRVDNEFFNNSRTINGSPLNANNNKGQWGGVDGVIKDTYSNENTLTFDKAFNEKHNVNVVAGFSLEHITTKGSGLVAVHVPYEEFGVDGLAMGTPLSNNYYTSEANMMSYFGRATYSYDSRYIATVTFRADGSSKFAPGNKWGYFPSYALAWNVANEKFMRNQRVITVLKLRSSYGFTGNNRVGDFDYLAALSSSLGNYYSFGNQAPSLGVGMNRMANSALRWEQTEQFDLGMDISFFKNRLNLTLDYYKKTTDDLLLKSTVPTHTGYSSVMQNIGAIGNSGFEISASSVNIRTKKFSWSSDFNISFNRNKVLKLAEGEPNRLDFPKLHSDYSNTPLFITQVGKPAGLFYGFIFDGVYQFSDFDQPSPGVYKLKNGMTNNGSTTVRPGDIKYKDVNGDLTIDAKDRVIIGNPHPDFIGGLNNKFSLSTKKAGTFYLSFLLQWSYGNELFNANNVLFEGNGFARAGINQFASYANRWTPDNPSNTMFKTKGQGPSGYLSDRTVEDGSYLRLKTLSFSYDMPKKWLKSMRLKGININVSAQNLFTITNYSGMDPEVSVMKGPLTPGFDFCGYPQAKTITVGLRLTL